MLQAERIVRELLNAADKFMRINKTDSAVLIVSPEIFAEISHLLSDIKHDKSYSSGHLGKHYVKSDPFIAQANKMIVYKPIEPEYILKLCTGDYLPMYTDPEVEKMRKHIKNAKKKGD